MTIGEAKSLNYGDKIIRFIGGKDRTFKVNGMPKTWVRTPDRVRVPLKYGLYEYGYMTEEDCRDYQVLNYGR